MFCYTVATGLGCVLREMLLWSNTSKEHQTFILTVADLTNQDLSQEITNQLLEYHKKFETIEDETKDLLHKMQCAPYQAQHIYHPVVKTVRKFLKYNYGFIKTLQYVKNFGENDQVWQTLLEHIEDEQKYMGRLLNNLLHQL